MNALDINQHNESISKFISAHVSSYCNTGCSIKTCPFCYDYYWCASEFALVFLVLLLCFLIGCCVFSLFMCFAHMGHHSVLWLGGMKTLLLQISLDTPVMATFSELVPIFLWQFMQNVQTPSRRERAWCAFIWWPVPLKQWRRQKVGRVQRAVGSPVCLTQGLHVYFSVDVYIGEHSCSAVSLH